MKREILKKRTFLWFDLTPRWKMWKKIEDLESEVGKALAERETAYQDLASMNQKFLALTHDLDSMQKRVLELEGKLQKFNRTRGKSGKYVKSYDTRSAKQDSRLSQGRRQAYGPQGRETLPHNGASSDHQPAP